MKPTQTHPVSVRIRKRGRAVHLGHRDYARTIQRALSRSGLPLHMTQGFHPHAKMRLPEPLPLGVGSDGEVFVVVLEAPLGVEEVRSRLAPQLPEDLALVEVVDGKCPEPRDIPLSLRVRGAGAASACEALGPELLGLAEYSCRRADGADSEALVELIPHHDQRVSVGKLVRALREAGVELVEVTRLFPRPAGSVSGGEAG